jgi:prepilin-type processing-associated H-X9-DG protein
MADVTGIPSTSSGLGSKFLPHDKMANVLFGDWSARAIMADADLKAKVEKIASSGTPPMSDFLSPTDPNNPGLWELFDKAP